MTCTEDFFLYILYNKEMGDNGLEKYNIIALLNAT